jgi:hypothetical protein
VEQDKNLTILATFGNTWTVLGFRVAECFTTDPALCAAKLQAQRATVRNRITNGQPASFSAVWPYKQGLSTNLDDLVYRADTFR